MFENMSEIILKANNISKSYNDLQVLKNVELDLMNNEVVSIVGASGAGKSTLLHILGTLDKPDAGSLTINGYDVVALSANKLAKFRNSQLGFVFQFHRLIAVLLII